MNPTAILALISAVLGLLEKLPPILAALRQSSALTTDQERELDERIARLRDQAHWRPDG